MKFLGIFILLLPAIVVDFVGGNEDVNNTLNYFKKVGIEISKLMCNNLDIIIESFDENYGKDL